MKKAHNVVLFIFCGKLFLAASFAQVSIGAKSDIIKSTKDNYPIVSYEIFEGKKYNVNSKARAFFFYIQGSEPQTVTTKLSYLASSIILGARAFMSEKRGCYHDIIDTVAFHKFDRKEIRMDDWQDVLAYYLKNLPKGLPVVVIGGSEGGDIASALAAKEKRITHLILIGSGGGWSQATELKFRVKKNPGYLNCKNVASLDSIINTFHTSTNDSLLWSGHTYKRWKSYLMDSSYLYLSNVNIPILLLHGDADYNVPVESARALADCFKAKGKNNLHYIEYKGLDHTLYSIQDKKNHYPFIEIDVMKWLTSEKLLTEKELNQFVRRVKRAHKDIFLNTKMFAVKFREEVREAVLERAIMNRFSQ